VVAAQRIDDAARAALTAALHRALGHPFEVTIEQVDQLTRSPVGKLEEFISHVSAR
jgi:phage-related minor tail protein